MYCYFQYIFEQLWINLHLFKTLNCKLFVYIKSILSLSSHILGFFFFKYCFFFLFQKWLSQAVPWMKTFSASFVWSSPLILWQHHVDTASVRPVWRNAGKAVTITDVHAVKKISTIEQIFEILSSNLKSWCVRAFTVSLKWRLMGES